MVCIAVVALGRIEREARGVFGGKAFARMLSRGVHLERERFLRRDELEEEREGVSKGTRDAFAEHAFRVMGNRFVEGLATRRESCGRKRVGSEPQFRPRGAVGLNRKEFRKVRGRAPRIALEMAAESPHPVPPE